MRSYPVKENPISSARSIPRFLVFMNYSTPIQDISRDWISSNSAYFYQVSSNFANWLGCYSSIPRFVCFHDFLDLQSRYTTEINKFTFYIFPQSFIKICLFVGVLDRFLDFHIIDFKRFRDFFLVYFFYEFIPIHFVRISIRNFWASLLTDVVILVSLSFLPLSLSMAKLTIQVALIVYNIIVLFF